MSAQKLVVYKNGDFALGEFTDDNVRAGSVQYQSLKGPQYLGEFDENIRRGPGMIKFDFEDDYKFEGHYDQNKKNGFGKFVSTAGLTEGMFTDGVLEGYGRSVTAEGLFYEGYFQDGKKEGYGLEVQPNSDVFIGEFRRDKKEGVGLYLFAKGGYYYGFFRNNEKSGLGVLYSRFNYAYYFGEFVADRKEGRGVEVFKDKSVYNGFYEGNKRSGPGIMEYSNKSTYVGEWKNAVRSGKGRCEAGKLVTSGNWEFDRIKVACAVDLDELMQPLYENKLPANIDAHLKQMAYGFTRKMLPDLSLNTMLKPPMLDSLKLRSAKGLIRGHILRKISNILNNSVVLNEVSDGIYNAFTQVPDHQKVFAPIGDRVDFKFQSGEYKIRWIGINFDDKKKPSFQLDHMIVSNDIIFGFSSEEKQNQYQLDGVCLPNGCLQIYQEFKASREVQRFTCVSGPNYLAGVDGDENKVFLIPDLQMYKGFFINGEAVHEKIPIALYMRIFGKEKIYGFGRDKIGIYMVSGTSKPGNSADPRPIVEFSCLYERDYEINYKGRLEGDEIVYLTSNSERRVEESATCRKVHA